MGVQILTKEDFEADDILATLATRGAAGFRVLVASGDRDTLQLVTDDVTVLYPNVRGVSELKTYDADAVRERYGIEPAQYPEIAALVGETSDNLIGIDKVGEKTAVKWIQQYGTVENLLAHADEITGRRRSEPARPADRAILNRSSTPAHRCRARLRPADLRAAPIDAPAVRDLFDRLQFKTCSTASSRSRVPPKTRRCSSSRRRRRRRRPMVQRSGDALRTWLEERRHPVGVRLARSTVASTPSASRRRTESVLVPVDGDRPGLAAGSRSDAPKLVHESKRAVKLLGRAHRARRRRLRQLHRRLAAAPVAEGRHARRR
jgi:DNA polymerase-1